MMKRDPLCVPISPPNRPTVKPPHIATELIDANAKDSKVSQIQPLEIPENHFLKWLHDRMSNNDITLNLAYDECKFVTEFIKSDEAKQWTSQTPVFISSQTGSGKTSFIYRVLIEEIILKSRDPDDKVLLLCNRVALSRQCKYAAARWNRDFQNDISYLNTLKASSAATIDTYHDFGSIHIYTYHQMYHL